jgi:hypothetical protein
LAATEKAASPSSSRWRNAKSSSATSNDNLRMSVSMFQRCNGEHGVASRDAVSNASAWSSGPPASLVGTKNASASAGAGTRPETRPCGLAPYDELEEEEEGGVEESLHFL